MKKMRMQVTLDWEKYVLSFALYEAIFVNTNIIREISSLKHYRQDILRKKVSAGSKEVEPKQMPNNCQLDYRIIE